MSKYSFKTDRNSMAVVFHSLMHNKNLNEWEKGFVDLMLDKFRDEIQFTENQLQQMSELWENY